MEDFSLNLLCRGKSHLLPLTLDSLKAQSGAFEILLLDGEGTGKLQELLGRYPGLNIRVENGKAKTLAGMMNLGITHSRGKYVQFLEPGERYISQHGLSYLTEQITGSPPLVICRGVCQEARSHWFLRSKLLEMGGFDEKIFSRPIFDLLCRYEKSGVEPFLCSRALVDAPIEKSPLIETCKILYRHFGLRAAMRWVFQGRSHTFHKAADFFKRAFLQEKN